MLGETLVNGTQLSQYILVYQRVVQYIAVEPLCVLESAKTNRQVVASHRLHCCITSQVAPQVAKGVTLLKCGFQDDGQAVRIWLSPCDGQLYVELPVADVGIVWGEILHKALSEHPLSIGTKKARRERVEINSTRILPVTVLSTVLLHFRITTVECEYGHHHEKEKFGK